MAHARTSWQIHEFFLVPAPPTVCLATTQAKVTWALPPRVVTVRVWTDPDKPEAPILQMTLPDTPRPHLITLHAQGIGEEINDDDELNEGWMELQLTIAENVTLSTSGKNARHLLSRPLPRHLHSLHLAGSNLTVDCHSGDEDACLFTTSFMAPHRLRTDGATYVTKKIFFTTQRR